jgi:hypothetical protein
VGNENVGVAVIVGVDVIVGVNVTVGVSVGPVVGVLVASGVEVKIGELVSVGGRGVGVIAWDGKLQASIASMETRRARYLFFI